MVPSRGTVTGVARMALMRVVDMAFLLSRKARLIRNRFYCRKLVLPLDQLEPEGLALVPRPRRIRRVPRPIARLFRNAVPEHRAPATLSPDRRADSHPDSSGRVQGGRSTAAGARSRAT